MSRSSHLTPDSAPARVRRRREAASHPPRASTPPRRPAPRRPASALSREVAAGYAWAAARLALGSIFLWAFLDKFFGLGHETASADSVLNGGNPTKGFLSGSVGPFSGIYHDIAGNVVVNVLFMAGLAFLGVALMSGIAMRLAAGAGALMMVLMWSASLPPANHIFMDDHLDLRDRPDRPGAGEGRRRDRVRQGLVAEQAGPPPPLARVGLPTGCPRPDEPRLRPAGLVGVLGGISGGGERIQRVRALDLHGTPRSRQRGPHRCGYPRL